MSKTKQLKPRPDVTEVEYHRPPTVSEIKFGYGATHYRTFPIAECTDSEGYIKEVFKAKDDKLFYSCR